MKSCIKKIITNKYYKYYCWCSCCQSYQIPKGWVLATSIRETQQMSDEFQDPERFLPERWISRKRDNLTQTERFGYIPFGAGARACPGRPLAMLYITTFVIEVVRRSRWTLKNPTPTIKYLPVTMPVDKLPITFRCRSGCDHSVPDKIRKAFWFTLWVITSQ